jgi:hypothetical protein
MTTKNYSPNSGALFISKKKTDKSPDHTGTIHLEKQFLTELIAASADSAIQLSVAAWDKTSATGLTYKALSLSKPKSKESQ